MSLMVGIRKPRELAKVNVAEEERTGREIPFEELRRRLMLYIQKNFGHDIEAILTKQDESGDHRNPSTICLSLMGVVQNVKGVLTRRCRSKSSHLHRNPTNKEPSSIFVQCRKCDAQKTDDNPTYDCAMGRYVARRLVCTNCETRNNSSNIWHTFVDNSMAFILYHNLVRLPGHEIVQDDQESENIEPIEDDQDFPEGEDGWADKDVQAEDVLGDSNSPRVAVKVLGSVKMNPLLITESRVVMGDLTSSES